MERIRIDYLRLSLTDRCNLDCIYCNPLQRNKFLNRNEVLSYEEMAKAASLFVKAGVRNLRLTGGEPLLKKDIVHLLKMLKGINGLDDISMTTNGILLNRMAGDLKQAGLDRVNISIDTLKRKRFAQITGSDHLEEVLNGIKMAEKVRLDPVKLNVILMKGINDDELPDFIRLAIKHTLIVRFIEFFPTNKRSLRLRGLLINNTDVKERIASGFGKLEKVYGIKGNGPAEYYRLGNSKGLIGFISSASENFCNGCNRIRMDCAGRIRPCLFSDYSHDMKPLLREPNNGEASLKFIREIFKAKSEYRRSNVPDGQLEMSSIGG
ncbi:MAG: GTP 3',8-cyclase MoaA [Candidatus Omnitrophota bacterium]